jgi:hypothetical protein
MLVQNSADPQNFFTGCGAETTVALADASGQVRQPMGVPLASDIGRGG